MLLGDDFETRFMKTKTFFKKRTFYLRVLSLKKQQFHTKLPNQKSMLRQVEQGVQNELITKNKVLSLTT